MIRSTTLVLFKAGQNKSKSNPDFDLPGGFTEKTRFELHVRHLDDARRDFRQFHVTDDRILDNFNGLFNCLCAGVVVDINKLAL